MGWGWRVKNAGVAIPFNEELRLSEVPAQAQGKHERANVVLWVAVQWPKCSYPGTIPAWLIPELTPAELLHSAENSAIGEWS